MTLLTWHRLSRRLSGWLLAALALAALAPAVSRALAAGPSQEGQDWVELCTTQGMQWVRADDPNGDPAAGPGSGRSDALDLCGHCTLAAERFAPLLPRWPVLSVVVASWPVPAFQAANRRSAEAPRAIARGPPRQG